MTDYPDVVLIAGDGPEADAFAREVVEQGHAVVRISGPPEARWWAAKMVANHVDWCVDMGDHDVRCGYTYGRPHWASITPQQCRMMIFNPEEDDEEESDER